MIMKKTGSNLLNMVNSMNTTPTPTKRKRKMRGPNIDIDDMPDIESQSVQDI